MFPAPAYDETAQSVQSNHNTPAQYEWNNVNAALNRGFLKAVFCLIVLLTYSHIIPYICYNKKPDSQQSNPTGVMYDSAR